MDSFFIFLTYIFLYMGFLVLISIVLSLVSFSGIVSVVILFTLPKQGFTLIFLLLYALSIGFL